MNKSIELRQFATPDDVAAAATDRIAQAAAEAIATRNRFVWALAGGQTPEKVYERLAEPSVAATIDWTKTFILWGDERCVPPDDPGSNFRMATEALLRHVSIPTDHVLRILGEAPPAQEAARYEHQLRKLLGDEAPIDLTLLGAGTDGHTASLFPGSAAAAERDRWVVDTPGPKPYRQRITLTLPRIRNSRHIIVLLTGVEKRPIVAGMMEQTHADWPVLAACPNKGTALWLADQAAVG
ncbi:MAG: 6-phosphogluconolactonase [Phycisphaerae bacterium]|nr:6-phosphogluconolactonase [Phycisphaerae bacterium]